LKRPKKAKKAEKTSKYFPPKRGRRSLNDAATPLQPPAGWSIVSKTRRLFQFQPYFLDNLGMKRWIAFLMFAHHSIAGVYDSSRQVTIEGVVKEFRFVNPHPFVLVDVKQNGGTQEWKLEMDNRSELVDAGMTDQTLMRRDRIVVTGSPVRSPQTHGMYIRKLDRPADGFQYEQVGSSPRITRPR